MAENSERVTDSTRSNSDAKGNTKLNPKKGKAPASKSPSDSAATVDSAILQCLQEIQQRQKQYDAKMDTILTRQKESDSKVDTVLNRVKKNEEALASFEENCEFYDDYYYECHDENDEGDGNLNAPGEGDVFGPTPPKVPKCDSRFAGMAKRFKGKEIVDSNIDSCLADNINDVFRKGMDEEQHSSLIKDESISRPENCEGLVTVKCNRIIWDLCSQSVKFTDKKLQNAQTSLIKGSILVAKAVNKLAERETELKDKADVDISPMIDQFNDSLSLFGHCNRQLCLIRRELIKPELKSEYSHLCNPSVAFTSDLFGDDVSKTAKELEDSARMGHKIQSGNRGSSRGRPPFNRGRRFLRGRGMRSRGSGPHWFTGSGTWSSVHGGESKNSSRRGQSSYRQ